MANDYRKSETLANISYGRAYVPRRVADAAEQFGLKKGLKLGRVIKSTGLAVGAEALWAFTPYPGDVRYFQQQRRVVSLFLSGYGGHTRPKFRDQLGLSLRETRY